MDTFTDFQTGREYRLYEDGRKSLAGYYYTLLPCPAVLYCADSGRWYSWDCASQSWRREQEYCRRYYDSPDAFTRILPPAGMPSPRAEEQLAEEKVKEKLRIRKEQLKRSWLEEVQIEVWFSSDGGCSISEDWGLDCAMGYVPSKWDLDAENTGKLLSLFGIGADGPALSEAQKQEILDKLNDCREAGEELGRVLERLHIHCK